MPIGARPPVPQLSELQSVFDAARAAKEQRRELGKAVERVEKAVGAAEGVLKMARRLVARRAGGLEVGNVGVGRAQ